MCQETLATRAKGHRNYVGNVERAERMSAIDSLDRFAQILDVSLAEFSAPSGAAKPERPIRPSVILPSDFWFTGCAVNWFAGRLFDDVHVWIGVEARSDFLDGRGPPEAHDIAWHVGLPPGDALTSSRQCVYARERHGQVADLRMQRKRAHVRARERRGMAPAFGSD